jgi:hypothetical protein
MQFNLLLRNSQGGGGGIKLRINLRKIIIKSKMNKHKHNHLLLRRNPSANQNFHASFLVNIITHVIFLIGMKLINFLRKFSTHYIDTSFSTTTFTGCTIHHRPSTIVTPPYRPLHIDTQIFHSILRSPKSAIKK